MDPFKKYKQPLLNTIEELCDSLVLDLPELSVDSQKALKILKEYSTRPSKRLRGSLAAMIVDDSLGSSLSPAGLKLGATIEIMQNHLLIIDDVIDRSITRRSMPTVHEIYLKEADTTRHKANMQAILVGMIAQHIATFGLLQIKAIPLANRAEAAQVLQRHILITDFGQIDDLEQVFGKKILTDDLVRKYYQKSSYYSFVDPIEAALTLTKGHSASIQHDAESFGLPAGFLFQLRDDYLGIFGDPTITGKSNLDDLREGKFTYLINQALQLSDSAQQKTLKSIVGNPKVTKKQLEQLQQLILKTGAEQRVQSLSQNLANDAKNAAVQAKSWSGQTANQLVELIDFIMERDH